MERRKGSRSFVKKGGETSLREGFPQAFTLIELLVALAVTAILAILMFPAARTVFAASTDAVSAHVIAQLNAASGSYLAENGMIYWPYRTTETNGVQWWFGFEPAESSHAAEGKRWLDLTRGPLGPFIAASGGIARDPSFSRSGSTFKPKFGNTHFAYGYNLLLQGKNRMAFDTPGRIPVFATCAQVNTFQPPASAGRPMVEEFYYFNATEKTVHFRIGGRAMVGYADGSAGTIPMMPGTADPRLPAAQIGRIDPCLVDPALIESGHSTPSPSHDPVQN